MKILLSGASGFLGSVLSKYLSPFHEVISLGRGSTNNILCDLSQTIPVLPYADIIIHGAGKAHSIPKSESEAKEFFDVNVTGTTNLLRAVTVKPKLFVFISSVSVYGLEKGIEISEQTPLKGESPYACSKIKAEELISDWGRDNLVNVVILRLPLISGPNPPGNLGAIMRAIQKGYYFRLGRGQARKSIVRAEDIANLIPTLRDRSGIYNLTDGYNPSLAELDECIAGHFGKKIKTLPEGVLKAAANLGDWVPFLPFNTYRLEKLTNTLTFSDQKAREELGWTPSPVIKNLF